MRYLLDTNVCVDYLTGRYPAVVARIHRSSPDDRYGADRSAQPKANHLRLDALVEEIECVDFDLQAAAAYGRLRAQLEVAGKPIGPNDMLIAAHALSLRLVLVTDNVDEFHRVKGLRLTNWRRQ